MLAVSARRRWRRAAAGSRRRAPPPPRARRRGPPRPSRRGSARRASVPHRRRAVSIATMPWPGAGTHDRAERDRDAAPRPRRFRPATASTRASYLAAIQFLQPRVHVAADRRERGAREERRRAARCGGRCRCRSPRRPGARSSVGEIDVSCRRPRTAAAPARRADPPAADTRRRRGRPGRPTDMSLALWTARSTSPRSSASSISLTNSPLPPRRRAAPSCSRRRPS